MSAELKDLRAVTLELSPAAANYAQAMANENNCTMEVWLARFLHQDTLRRMDENSRFLAAYHEVWSRIAPKERVEPEREIEKAICAQLDKLGVAHRRQVKTFAGIADIVTDSAVVEIKKSIRSLGTFHQAMGQAMAYARALGRPRAMVAAAAISPGLAKRVTGLVLSHDVAAFLSRGDENSLPDFTTHHDAISLNGAA